MAAPRRPVVGIVGYDHVVPRHWGELGVTGAPTSYVDAVTAAGGLPVLLPGPAAVGALDVVDVVVLTGGGDVSPDLYDGGPAGAREVDPVRDERELALVRTAAERRTPLLAVCRGMQLLAVAGGGRLVEVGMGHVLPESGHPVRAAAGSVLAALLGERPDVSSIHHQAVGDAGGGWAVTAWADDGVAEAMEPLDPTWPALAVQWHPERDGTGPALFGWLVDAARSHGEPVRSRSVGSIRREIATNGG